MLINDSSPYQGGRVALVSVEHAYAAHGLCQKVLSGTVTPRPCRAVTGERTVHDLRVRLVDLLVTKAEAIQYTRPEVLDDDVCLFDEFLYDLLTFFRPQVDAQAPLIPSSEQEKDAHTVLKGFSAGPVPFPCPLDGLYLDDVSPKIR